MALTTTKYNACLEILAKNDWSDTGNNYAIQVLNDSYTFDASNTLFSDVSDYVIGSGQALVSRSISTAGTFTAADFNLNEAYTGARFIVVLLQTGAAITSLDNLVFCIDLGEVINLTVNDIVKLGNILTVAVV